jgi:hypothetical protein
MLGSSRLDNVYDNCMLLVHRFPCAVGSRRPKLYRTTVALALPLPAIIDCCRKQNHCVRIEYPLVTYSAKSVAYLPGFAAATLRDLAADGRAWTSSFDRVVEDATECSLPA